MTTAFNPETIVKRLPELKQLWIKKDSASTAFNDACKAVSKNSDIRPSVIKAYITAICSEKRAEHKEKAAQLSLLFDEIPEG